MVWAPTMYKLILFIFAFIMFSCPALARTPAPGNAELYFISLDDGDALSNPITIRFGLKNMGVAPAGIQYEDSGHHHLLIDTSLPPLDLPIINDEKHRHFGKGQTETVLELPPGAHTLQLLLGDFAHIPHDPPVMSKQVTITVK